MSPIETTKLAVEFTGPAAPGWLILLIPAGLLLVWRLYKLQFKDVSRFSRIALLVIRCIIVAGILLLIFRPVIVSRKTLTYPGRILLVVDDSESMLTSDNRLPHGEALYVARRLNPESAEAYSEYHQAADILRGTFQEMKRFQLFSRDSDRTTDRFWTEAESFETAIESSFDEAIELLSNAAGDAVSENDRIINAALDELRQTGKTFFAGERHPGRERFETYYENLAALRARILSRQAEVDGARLAETDTANVLTSIRTKRRTELLADSLATNLASSRGLAVNQFIKYVSLMTGERKLLAGNTQIGEVSAIRGETDIANAILKLVEEESSFPLTAVVLFSDGRDIAGGDFESLKQGMARRRIPLFTAGIGDTREPYDISVVNIVAPPFAVEGERLVIQALLKTVLPEPKNVKVHVLSDDEVIATREILLGGEEMQMVDLAFTPSQSGIARYTVLVDTVPGEAFPRRNNRADFAMDVRDEPVRVMMLDWRPRWETRFAGTVLRNLDYVELNKIILIAEPNLELSRGVGRGYWPNSFDALNMYDLLILGDVPEGVLSEEELEDIRRFVKEAGKAVCFLSPDSPNMRKLMAEFIPAPDTSIPDDRNMQVRSTGAGGLHPTTHRFQQDGGALTLDTNVYMPDTQVLAIHQQTRRPFIAARFVENGRAMSIASEYLWRVNHSQYAAHREAYIQMITWALQAKLIADDEESPALAVDASVFNNRRGFQVWVYDNGNSNAEVIMHAGEDQIGESAAILHYHGSVISRAAFFNPQMLDEPDVPGDVYFSLKGDPGVSTGRIVVIDDYRELDFLAQDKAFMQKLAEEAGGSYRQFVDFEDFFYLMEARTRNEEFETRWRVWNSMAVLLIMAGLLTIQWIWRKFVGLV